MVASFFAGGSEPAQLVQRSTPATGKPALVVAQGAQVDLPVPLAASSGGPSLPGSLEPPQAGAPHTAPLTLSMTAELTAPPADPRPAAKTPVTAGARPNQPPLARPTVAPVALQAQGSNVRSQRPSVTSLMPEAQAAPVPIQRNTWIEPAPPEEKIDPPPVVATPPPQPAPAPSRPPVPRAGLTLVEAQPLLSQLLQQMESGRGERLLSLLDAEARSKPAAQAFSRQFDSLVDGARPVRLSHVEFKAEPGDGRLYVVGHLRLLAGDQTIGAMGKKMSLRAEFASRQGAVVLTGLSTGPSN